MGICFDSIMSFFGATVLLFLLACNSRKQHIGVPISLGGSSINAKFLSRLRSRSETYVLLFRVGGSDVSFFVFRSFSQKL